MNEREEYIQIRKNVFESMLKNQQPTIPIDFFYRYYVEEFEKLPKIKKIPKKDMFGGIIVDDKGNIIWEEKENILLSIYEFSQYFGTFISFSNIDIFETLDKKFNISWLCNKLGNKLKLVI
jgi:hypothetical protein